MKSKLFLLMWTLLLAGAVAEAQPLLDFPNVAGEKIKLSGAPGASPIVIGTQDTGIYKALYLRTGTAISFFAGGTHVNGYGDPGPGGIPLAEMYLSGGQGILSARRIFCDELVETSDRNVKENIEPVDCRKVLDQLLSLPIYTWSLTNGHSRIRNIGPMAQDFHAIFRFGSDDKHIAARNTAGVALTAIQGLHRIVQEQRLDLQRQATRIAELEKRTAKMGSLEERVKELERWLKASNSK